MRSRRSVFIRMKPFLLLGVFLSLLLCVHSRFSFGRAKMNKDKDKNAVKDNISIAAYEGGYATMARDGNALQNVNTGTNTGNTGNTGNSVNTGNSANSGSYSSGNTYSANSYGGGGSNYGGTYKGGNSYGGGYRSSYGGGYGGNYGDSYSSSGYGSSYSGGYGKSANPVASLIAPLAGLALLGAAAAVATNPVLLTLAVLTSGRKKRDANGVEDSLQFLALDNINTTNLDPLFSEKVQELQTLEKYISSVPSTDSNEKLMAGYLSCSGFMESSNKCMDRIVCEYSDPDSPLEDLERDVISIVLHSIMGNKLVNPAFKERLRAAAKHGSEQGRCYIHKCLDISIAE
ncbi:keratin, type II cytoskeletal 1-like isoform X1 [Artemia franciscana]|uniref:keratin, type II cytoskeletal 1-like isoform X1 n=2 Tax=Artemia franciscana TaxID=6661 RepID=UPI0032DB069D